MTGERHFRPLHEKAGPHRVRALELHHQGPVCCPDLAMPDRSLSSETRPDPLTSGPSESAPRFPKQRLEAHVKRLYPRSEPAVREAALEALERRRAFSQRDELRIAESPKDSIYGRYILRRKGRKERPYDTMLRSLEPLAYWASRRGRWGPSFMSAN
ncbi:MAG: hypothetical protein AAF368_13010, partial [Planctomycetota bacterium]